MLTEACVWQKTCPKTTDYPTLSENIKTPVCVIGGGFTGLSTALHLAEQGVSSVVLESQYIGAGGSGRNVGFVNAGTWAQPDALNGFLGETAGEILTKALGNAPKLVFDVIDKYQIEAKDTRTGNLHMAHNGAGEADIDSRYAQLTRRGANVEVLTGAKAHEYSGTTRINKILLDKRAGTINPFAYANGLAKAAHGLGVKIFEKTAVTELKKDGEQWLVTATSSNGTSHTITADKVVIATNAYTQGEWTDITKSFYLVQYYQIASEPLDNEVANRILPYKNGSWDTRMALSSIRRDSENRLLLGTVGGRAFKPASFYQAWANHVTKHYFPDLPKFNWQYEWFGDFGFTPDHILRVFEPQNGILAATAYNGRGITTGTLMGKSFADYLVSDDKTKIPLPFKTPQECEIAFRHARAVSTEIGLTLYHSGQCLNIIS